MVAFESFLNHFLALLPPPSSFPPSCTQSSFITKRTPPSFLSGKSPWGFFLANCEYQGVTLPTQTKKKKARQDLLFCTALPWTWPKHVQSHYNKNKKKTTQKKSRAGVSKNCFRIRNTDPLPLHFARRLSGDHPILFAGSLPVLPPPYTPSLASTAFLSLGGPHPRNKKDCTRPFGCGQGVVAGVKAISQEKKAVT